MVRRTRSEIIEYFWMILLSRDSRFPEVEKPVPCFYEHNAKEDQIIHANHQADYYGIQIRTLHAHALLSR
jgi:hypothetical protein